MAEDFKSHVAEDVSDIPVEFHLSKEELKSFADDDSESFPQLFRALYDSRKQGTASGVRNANMLNINSRHSSFCSTSSETASSLASLSSSVTSSSSFHFESTIDDDEEAPQWPGPSPRKMAMAGFHRSFSGIAHAAECPYCGVNIRNWQPSDDPWERHKKLSPRCLRLRQVGDEGIHPAPEGKKRLRHSCSSLYDLKR